MVWHGTKLKISYLFGLQMAGKEAKRFQDLCTIKPLAEQILLTRVGR